MVAKVKESASVTLVSIRVADKPRFKEICRRVGMTGVEYLSRVLSRDEKKATDELSRELLASASE